MEKPEVGYKVPPKEHQFKPGQSGNPRGRTPQRPVKSFSELFQEEAELEVRIVRSGEEQYTPKMELLLERLIIDALSGDMNKAKQLLKLIKKPQKPAYQGVILHPIDLSRDKDNGIAL